MDLSNVCGLVKKKIIKLKKSFLLPKVFFGYSTRRKQKQKQTKNQYKLRKPVVSTMSFKIVWNCNCFSVTESLAGRIVLSVHATMTIVSLSRVTGKGPGVLGLVLLPLNKPNSQDVTVYDRDTSANCRKYSQNCREYRGPMFFRRLSRSPYSFSFH